MAVGLVDAAGWVATIRRTGRQLCYLCGRMLLIVGVETIELFEAGDDVADVEEAVALEAEVNERRLHAGQHFRYPALVDVADDATRSLAFDEYLGDLIVLEDRDPCFVGARGDDHLLAHARSSRRAARAGGFRPRVPRGT